MLDGIRATAEPKVRALPTPPPTAGSDEFDKQAWWTKAGAIVGAAALVAAVVGVIVVMVMG